MSKMGCLDLLIKIAHTSEIIFETDVGKRSLSFLQELKGDVLRLNM